jgi:hypothetical protein
MNTVNRLLVAPDWCLRNDELMSIASYIAQKEKKEEKQTGSES